ncbi:MAG: hypothetical protein WC241_04265 [Candidatus Paceibacterota bacterium]|jgi:hypothetical protein
MSKIKMQKLKTPLEKSEEIFKKNLTKAAETLISLLSSDDETIRLSATKYIIERITNKPVIIVMNDSKKKST